MPASRKGFSLCAFVINFILVVILVFGGVAIYLQQVAYKGGTRWYHSTDMVSMNHISKSISTVWCTGYSVSSPSDLSVYLLPTAMAQIDPVNRSYSRDHSEGINAGVKSFVDGYYLLKGSMFNVTACRKNNDHVSNASSQILIFKDGNFNDWTENMDCDTCILKRLPIQQWCNDNKTDKLNFFVENPATYTIAIARVDKSQVGLQVYLDVNIRVNKSVYDIDGAVQKCKGVNECKLDLKYNTDRDVVVQFESTSIVDAYFTSECEERVVIWVCIFLIIPLVLIFGLLGFLSCCELRLKRKERARHGQEITTGYDKMADGDELVNNEQIPNNL